MPEPLCTLQAQDRSKLLQTFRPQHYPEIPPTASLSARMQLLLVISVCKQIASNTLPTHALGCQIFKAGSPGLLELFTPHQESHLGRVLFSKCWQATLLTRLILSGKQFPLKAAAAAHRKVPSSHHSCSAVLGHSHGTGLRHRHNIAEDRLS